MIYRSLTVSVLCLVAFAAAAGPDDASALMRAVGEHYKAIRSYEAEGTAVLELTSRQARVNANMTLIEAHDRGDKVRFEVKDPKFGAARVSNGKTTWFYQQRTNRYTTTQGPPPKATPTAGPMGGDGTFEYPNIAATLKTAHKTGEETLVVNGSPVKCVVIEVTYDTGIVDPDVVPAPRILWIDPARQLVVKDLSASTLQATKPPESRVELKFTRTLTKIRVNQPVPAQVFEFHPPEGAVEATSTSK